MRRGALPLLTQNRIISAPCSTAMKHMVGFRNIAVHSYQQIQDPILQAILQQHLTDFEDYLSELSL